MVKTVYICVHDLFHILLSLWHTHGSMECMCICMYFYIYSLPVWHTICHN